MEPQRGRARLRRPHPAHELPVRGERLLAVRPAHTPPQGHLQAPAAHARAGRAARPVAGGCGRARDEGMGTRERRHPLHPRLPAAHRAHRREARLVLCARRRRRGACRVLRQGAHPGRARRVLVPHRRRARDVRGPWLHGLGPDEPGLHPREPQRRAPLHPDCVRVLDRRGARRQDPAPALDGRAVGLGNPRPAIARRRYGGARVHHRRARAGVLPHRRAVLLPAARPHQHRPHVVRRQAAQGPRARRPLLRLDPRARARVHDGPGARAGEAGCAGEDAPQRGRSRSVRDRAGVRELERRLGPPAAHDAAAPVGRAQVRARLSAAREAVRGRERLRQAQQLVDGHRHAATT